LWAALFEWVVLAAADCMPPYPCAGWSRGHYQTAADNGDDSFHNMKI
jgi:hypothetical protein